MMSADSLSCSWALLDRLELVYEIFAGPNSVISGDSVTRGPEPK